MWTESTCTLINAIATANTGTATGGCTGGTAGADTVYLGANVALTAANNNTYGPTGLPVVTSAITIEGNGHGNRAGIVRRRRFASWRWAGGGNLTLNSATVSGGLSTGSAYYSSSARGRWHLCRSWQYRWC